jgi:predicted dehydrogenase
LISITPRKRALLTDTQCFVSVPGFTVSYDSGLSDVPDFDAHIQVYSANKIVRVKYEWAYIKGAQTTMRIVESSDDTYREPFIRHTQEDEYTLELKEFYRAVTTGKPIKTSAQDARMDLDIFMQGQKTFQ